LIEPVSVGTCDGDGGLSALIAAVALTLSGLARVPETVGAARKALPRLAAEITAESSGHPENKNGAEADDSHDDPPNPGRKTVHGVVSPRMKQGYVGIATVNEV
jgi:hypothetical protein